MQGGLRGLRIFFVLFNKMTSFKKMSSLALDTTTSYPEHVGVIEGRKSLITMFMLPANQAIASHRNNVL